MCNDGPLNQSRGKDSKRRRIVPPAKLELRGSTSEPFEIKVARASEIKGGELFRLAKTGIATGNIATSESLG